MVAAAARIDAFRAACVNRICAANVDRKFVITLASKHLARQSDTEGTQVQCSKSRHTAHETWASQKRRPSMGRARAPVHPSGGRENIEVTISTQSPKGNGHRSS